MEILKLNIYQPNANYRMPFSYLRRHTYPIPPYSTILGFLINILGIWDQNENDYYRNILKIKLSIASKFDDKLDEYVWFRNLSKEYHIKKFGYIENRYNNNHIEHIGGQSPIKIDVLNNVHLTIYLAHEEKSFLEYILKNLIEPKNRLEVLHIGRAEDWIVLEDKPIFLEDKDVSYERRDADYNYFFWIPENFYIKDEGIWKYCNFDNFNGLLYNIPVLSHIENYERDFNKNAPRRFDYKRTKLNDGLIYNQILFLDKSDPSEIMPIFLTNVNGVNNDNLG
jgi:CRISPR-associated protein Cas5t